MQHLKKIAYAQTQVRITKAIVHLLKTKEHVLSVADNSVDLLWIDN